MARRVLIESLLLAMKFLMSERDSFLEHALVHANDRGGVGQVREVAQANGHRCRAGAGSWGRRRARRLGIAAAARGGQQQDCGQSSERERTD